MTDLKNVKVVADSLAPLQLEEKNPSPAFYKEDKIPKCIVEPRIVSELPSSCPICTKFGHTPEQCPWRRRLPFGVTQVGKGYEIYGRHPDKKIETTRLWKERPLGAYMQQRLITVDDFFMLTLENENNTVLERIEGNPIKSKERGSGTVTSAMLLELGLVLGSDSRITREDDRIGADKLKLQTIRVHPPTFGVWCGDYEAANRFLQALKSMAKLGKSIEFLVKRGEAFLNKHDDMDAFAVYVCCTEDQVPAGYIFYYNPQVVKHKQNCKGVDDCKCPIDYIKRGSRKLVYGGVFNDGSGGKYAHNDLSRLFKDGKKEKQDDAEDYKLVQIKEKLGIGLGKARFLTRFAMFRASLKDSYCVCSVTTDGIIEREGPFGFIRTCLDFFNMLKAREKTLFLIYHKRLEGSNFGRFVVENIPIGYEKVKHNGHRVALLQGDFCLHHLTLKEAEDVNELFNSANLVIKRPHFSTNEFHLKSYTVNTTTLKRNKRKREGRLVGFESAKFSYNEVAMFNDYEVIYMGRPTKDFLKSLKEMITFFKGESPDDNQV
ncbi:hypothetical protein D8674_033201 [Pyrus ussuriensis x Pyrus communis]|uniref:Uncharacterized protein n=1 Tax=Pyrus ussuriensis x Pyrus communis TaxID=2448454 RepID=A0A5N5HKC0_9ROSA|nr:hypothetical protein D8674_033201 [Pyrus ussuriensis x Pyrus communis]